MIGNILIRDHLNAKELNTLLTEFPQYKLLSLDPDGDLISLGVEDCSEIEVIYGCCISQEEINLLPQLHWIHSPSPYLDKICAEFIKKQGNILITTTKSENLIQVGAFAIGAAMAFAKKLFSWEERSFQPESLNLERIRSKMWNIEECLFLQIGLGRIGTEISRRAKQEGFTVWGVQEIPTFHPHCEKVIPLSELDSVLPNADIVCLAMPREKPCDPWFAKDKLELMKEDSVILGFGTGSVFELDDLAEIGIQGKFRGILLDSHFSPPIPENYPLLQKRRAIITHESSTYPLIPSEMGFNVFVYNLRQYVHGNYSDMKNLL